jgi:pectate lyase
MRKKSLIRKIECMVLVLLVIFLGQVFASPCGDVNSSGSIDIVDALLTAQYAVGLNPSNFDSGSADVNGDGSINIVDALLIAQYSVGLITSLPGCADTPAPTAAPTTPPNTGDIAVPNGYAEGTTGGGNASARTVSSASDFKSAVGGTNAAVIIVNGRIDMGGDVTIGSNKTIKGANSSSGLYNGAVKVQGTNCIIQNLTIGPHTDGDVLEVSGATRIFIHKCTFHDSSDELCSIVRQADYVTVSWCRYYFDSPTDHSYGNLIGNGDDVTADRGKLHVTMHHNWYDNGVKGRMPRVRYGYVHIYNNYYSSNNTDYCIGAGYECHVRVENTHFDNVDDPWADYGAPGSGGQIGWSNLKFEGCSQPTFMSNSFPVFSPPYSFSMDPVDSVENIVRNGAGNR